MFDFLHILTEDILVAFLLLMVALFLIPKICQRYHIPAPIVEFFLGVLVITTLPFLLTESIMSIVEIFSAIGVITIFLFAGLEADFHFLKKNKWTILLGILSQLILLVVIAVLIVQFFGDGLMAGLVPGTAWLTASGALLVALVLITPSAGFIVSMLNTAKLPARHRAHHLAKALSAEIVAIFLLIILTQMHEPRNLVLILIGLSCLIVGLPWLVKVAYTKLLSKIVNIEFSFFFLIALLSAFVTDMLGLHFIVGAFIAGLVIHLFIDYLVGEKEISGGKADRLVHGMHFLSTLFVPFYFFSVGLKFRAEYLQWQVILAAFLLFVVVSVLRVISIGGVQAIYRGKFWNELKGASVLLPTLMVGFIFADLLFITGWISEPLFAIMIWYAIFTSLTPIVLKKRFMEVVIPHKYHLFRNEEKMLRKGSGKRK